MGSVARRLGATYLKSLAEEAGGDYWRKPAAERGGLGKAGLSHCCMLESRLRIDETLTQHKFLKRK
jgi:hypothetical protein